MKKILSYSLIALMGLFAACKKEPKPVDPIATDPYKHSRPIESSSDDGSIYKYSYNTANQIVKMEYSEKGQPGFISLLTYTYANGKLSQIVIENGTSTKYITDYTYQGNTDFVESTFFNAIDYENPALPVIISTINTDYSYVDGKIFKMTTKNDKNIPTLISTYSFSIKGENTFVSIDHIPQVVNGFLLGFPYNTSTEYYKDVIDPISYFLASSTNESKFFPKAGTSSAYASSNYNQTYELDNVGRIKTISRTVPSNQNTVKTTYTYETY
ncbi:hypothetical protein GM921_16440 [Pedobacter sp. LMG 31464]|uniref:YD repeat-containing protein n=1 Tax=Pedobacter planticolens TaxID=2679964 RepID=A0A923E2M0_9SPHI|nr:hypothetical protein [Pedobacter planticolens]MBB2147095.1 hypothetical protein [Pedobacter planticolens]